MFAGNDSEWMVFKAAAAAATTPKGSGGGGTRAVKKSDVVDLVFELPPGKTPVMLIN